MIPATLGRRQGRHATDNARTGCQGCLSTSASRAPVMRQSCPASTDLAMPSSVGGPWRLAKGLPVAQCTWSSPACCLAWMSPAAPDADALHRGWRRWLQLYNTVQFHARRAHGHVRQAWTLMTTKFLVPWAVAIRTHLASRRDACRTQRRVAGRAGTGAFGTFCRPEGTWLPPELRRLRWARSWRMKSAKCLRDAEVTWVDQKLALLRPDQTDLADAWHAAGWTARRCWTTKLTTVQGQPWIGSRGGCART